MKKGIPQRVTSQRFPADLAASPGNEVNISETAFLKELLAIVPEHRNRLEIYFLIYCILRLFGKVSITRQKISTLN